MSSRKRCKLTQPDHLGLCNLAPSDDDSPLDWNLCILCQEHTSERLKCPAHTKRDDVGVGYTTLAKDLKGFIDIDKQPVSVDIRRLDFGEGIESNLREQTAKWHSSCRLKCSASRLTRADKTDTISPSADNSTDNSADLPFTRKANNTGGKLITCFFCDGHASDKYPLHEAMTKRLTKRVMECALQIKDMKLIAKLSCGDLVAQDAKYHSHCLVKLYNSSTREQNTSQCTNSDKFAHGIALVELMGFIQDTKDANPSISPVFKLADLTSMYSSRLEALGIKVTGRVHSTDLKIRLLSNIPGLQAHRQNRDVMLAFDDDIGNALREACADDGDDEAICLAKAAKILRRDMLGTEYEFNGSFAKGCQEDAVPNSLVALVNMVLDGPNIRTENTDARQATLSIAQLLLYNSTHRRRKGAAGTHHTTKRETPLPIYLGLMMHGKTGKRNIVDSMFHLGLSISYDRVLEISTSLAISAAEQYEIDDVVCPLVLRKNLFTVAAGDNLDHNPSSTSAQGAFHGTGISLFQNRTQESDGITRPKVELHQRVKKQQIPALPESYTLVTPVSSKTELIIPPTNGPLLSDTSTLKEAIEEEQKWQENTHRLMNDDIPNVQDPICWAAFHSNKQQKEFDITISSLLPLFPDDSKSVAMIRHSMKVVRQAVHLLNPGQVPVITFDQPLFAIAKSIQWNWPSEYGEEHFIIVLGGLHIEMAAWSMLGDLLDSSGWTHAITQASVATSGVAESLLKAKHVTRTRHAHQVTVSALSMLVQRAYNEYSAEVSEPVSFEDWCLTRTKASPQFQFWRIIMQLETLILIYVRSIREANFSLYVASLVALVPWFFALDHTHYSRWLPIHIRDMITLNEKHPTVAREFSKGGFVVHKTKRMSSAIAIDHAHEQNNKLVKGDGGAVMLLQNPKSLLRWMVGSPEQSRIIEEFDQNYLSRYTDETNCNHHEHNPSAQVTFAKECNALVCVIEEMGNPFMEESDDLLVLDCRDIADPAVVESVRAIERTGKEQYETYLNERMLERSSAISNPIKKNQLPLFSRPPTRVPSKAKQVLSSLKSDCALFSRLYISCQTRDGDLETFFKHENHAYPPSISQMGKLRIGTKSDLVSCLEQYCVPVETFPSVDVIVLDGAAIVNILKPCGVKTFQEYATQVFLPFIKTQLNNVLRMDIIFDVYLPDSLKSTARERRGHGIRRRVTASNVIPGNWQDFLRLDENKTELFYFLAYQIVENLSATEKLVYTTCDKMVLCNKLRQDVSSISPCSHEEADTRMLLHAADAANRGHRKILLRTVDTDVLVLAIFTAALLDNTEIWVAFGTGKHFRYIPAHDICKGIGKLKACALPMFHAFTGCDTVSSFAGRGKKTAFEVWKSFDDVTKVFSDLTKDPTAFSEDVMSVLEQYVVLLYNRTCPERNVDLARKYIFTTKARSIDALPPTQGALIQHTKRAIYQGGNVWGQSLVTNPILPSPSTCGWQKSAGQSWQPLWTELPEAVASCSELLRCGCQKSCSGLCKCHKAALKCTSLCRCMGNCDNNDTD